MRSGLLFGSVGAILLLFTLPAGILAETGQKQFVIHSAGGRTTKEVIAATYHETVHQQVNSTNFPMEELRGGTATIEFIDRSEFDQKRNPTFEEILAEADRRGLKRPTSTHALLFDEQYAELEGSFIFLIENSLNLPGGLDALEVVHGAKFVPPGIWDESVVVGYLSFRWKYGMWGDKERFGFIREG